MRSLWTLKIEVGATVTNVTSFEGPTQLWVDTFSDFYITELAYPVLKLPYHKKGRVSHFQQFQPGLSSQCLICCTVISVNILVKQNISYCVHFL